MKLLYITFFIVMSFNSLADVFVDLSKINEGEYMFVNWQNIPVLIYHRTDEEIEKLKSSANKVINLAPFDFYARRYSNNVANSLMQGKHIDNQPLRSLNVKWFVAMGASPELGVKLRVKSEESMIMDPMDGTLYDLTGKVIKNHHSKKDLSIPDYNISNQTLTIFTKVKENDIDFSKGRVKSDDPPEKQILDALNWKKFNLAGTLLEKYPSVIRNSEVNSLVLVAATTYGDNELLQKAIHFGAEINIVFKNKSTPLNTAIVSNNLEIAQYLIENGAITEKFCHPTDINFCSTPTMEIAKMIAGMENLVGGWIKNQRKNQRGR